MRRNGRKLGKTVCTQCGKKFEKPQSEIDRNAKRNGNNFCSRHCVGLHNSGNLLLGNESSYDISQHARKKDEDSKFRYYFRTIKNRNKELNVTIDDLRDLWEKQEGKCFYTKINLVLSEFTNINKNPIYSASIDRIDSSKGYIKGNICWVSRSVNYMKGTLSVDMFWELCEHIYNVVKEKKWRCGDSNTGLPLST